MVFKNVNQGSRHPATAIIIRSEFWIIASDVDHEAHETRRKLSDSAAVALKPRIANRKPRGSPKVPSSFFVLFVVHPRSSGSGSLTEFRF